MNKSEMEDLVQQQLEAYNCRDLDKFCSCYHKDVVVANLLADQVVCRGMDKFREIYKNLFESSPNLNCELKSRVTLESAIIDEENITGSARHPQGLHTAAIYGFRDGLINRVWFSR